MTNHMKEYAAERNRSGMTIAEYEELHGLPAYTVWPQARGAQAFADLGRWLYETATDAQRAGVE